MSDQQKKKPRPDRSRNGEASHKPADKPASSTKLIERRKNVGKRQVIIDTSSAAIKMNVAKTISTLFQLTTPKPNIVGSGNTYVMTVQQMPITEDSAPVSQSSNFLGGVFCAVASIVIF